jgi:hypothetical protein
MLLLTTPMLGQRQLSPRRMALQKLGKEKRKARNEF